MKFIPISSVTLVICTLFWKPCDSAELSAIPAIFLKPMMYFNRMVVAPIRSRPDYICIMNPSAKNKLCEMVFNQKDMKIRYKVRYDEQVDTNKFDFSCHLRAFNCWVNNLTHLGLSQAMLLCPVVSTETGERVTKYHLSTNYSADRVIVFEAEEDGRVVAVVGVYIMDLDEVKKNFSGVANTNTSD